MAELWYAILAVMLALYVVLDGYDLGAGALHLAVARNDPERRTVLAAIGPFWDANEVWLLASGGVLFVAFPRALAAGLSGFYLAIFLVIWCLVLRAVAIEFRSHVAEPLWRNFWDVVLAGASGLLPVLFGAAFGNLIRGVPLGREGWFELTLFTSFLPREPVGILDWYTVLAGVFALVALLGHGAAFLTWRTEGPVQERSRQLAFVLYVVLAVLWPLVTLATHAVNPSLLAALPGRPLGWLGLALPPGGMGGGLGGAPPGGPRARRPRAPRPPAGLAGARPRAGGQGGRSGGAPPRAPARSLPRLVGLHCRDADRDRSVPVSGAAAGDLRSRVVDHRFQRRLDHERSAHGARLVGGGLPRRAALLRDPLPHPPWQGPGSGGGRRVLGRGDVDWVER